MIKRTHRSIIKGVNWILAGILSILGFSGCQYVRTGPDEYGSPYATFSFHGKVTDKAGKPVKDIQVEVRRQIYPVTKEPASTDASGRYSIRFQDDLFEDYQMIVSDIDGEANGSFLNDTVRVKVTKEDYYEEGKSNWDYGSADKEVDIVLKEKE
jgi:putative lipoprotein (rSAM/lipoprotein system)